MGAGFPGMSSPNDRDRGFDDFYEEEETPAIKKIPVPEVLKDLKAGLRTRGFMIKYGLTLAEFEELIKRLVRQGLLTKEEFKAWKSHRPETAAAPIPAAKPAPAKPTATKPASAQDESPDGEMTKVGHTVTTYVINEPEKNESWALQLFAINRDSIKGAKFKVNLHGRRYAFVVEDMLYRGQVRMRQPVKPKKQRDSKVEVKDKRELAMEYIAKHGWAAYLENRAYNANFEAEEHEDDSQTKARLVILHCKNDTYLAAVHTPLPAVNLYVSTSLKNILGRLGKSVDTSELDLTGHA